MKVVATVAALTLPLWCQFAWSEVYKCVDAGGHASYQDTTCDESHDTKHIDKRFANTLTLGFTGSNARTIKDIAEQHEAGREVRIRERDEAIEARVAEFEEKEARCKALRLELEAMYERQRRGGRRDAGARAELVGRMRDACSA